LILEPKRLDFFYQRLVKQNSTFDLTHLARLVTSCRKESIIDSTTIKVQGLSEEHRRTKPLKGTNPNLAASLTRHNETTIAKSSATKAYETPYINNRLLV